MSDTQNWWCPMCEQYVQDDQVTYYELHDVRAGGCGFKVEPSNVPRRSWLVKKINAALARFGMDGI